MNRNERRRTWLRAGKGKGGGEGRGRARRPRRRKRPGERKAWARRPGRRSGLGARRERLVPSPAERKPGERGISEKEAPCASGGGGPRSGWGGAGQTQRSGPPSLPQRRGVQGILPASLRPAAGPAGRVAKSSGG